MSRRDAQSDLTLPVDATARRLTITLSGCPDGLSTELLRTARRALRVEGHRRGRLDIAVVGDTEMRRQNARWVGQDSSTDVLAFDLRDAPEAGRVDGQLLVCKSVARRRARARRSNWQGELLLYAVHGCLHLCGYDDRRPDDAAKMHRREDEILTALGWGPVFAGQPTPAAREGRRDRAGGPGRRRPAAARGGHV